MNEVLLTIHLLAVTVWVGGHIVMTFGYLPELIKTRDLTALSEFENRYEKIGKPSLVALIVTGLWMGLNYNSNPLNWFSFSNDMYNLLGLKSILLIVTLGLAIDAHTRIAKKEGEDAVKATINHIILVTIVAVLMLRIGMTYS